MCFQRHLYTYERRGAGRWPRLSCQDGKQIEEHEDREAIEETGRGDRKVGADEAGTAMALRGEHDARSAST
jgi:hypothetical protein